MNEQQKDDLFGLLLKKRSIEYVVQIWQHKWEVELNKTIANGENISFSTMNSLEYPTFLAGRKLFMNVTSHKDSHQQFFNIDKGFAAHKRRLKNIQLKIEQFLPIIDNQYDPDVQSNQCK